VSRFVLVTRHPDDCRELQELLRPHDLVVRPFPVLRVEEVEDSRGWKAALSALPAGASTRAWTILASPRAPRRFAEQASRRQAHHLLELPVAAVGPTTAREAEHAGLDVRMVGSSTGKTLADELVATLDGPITALFPCGHHRRPELPDTLTAAGHRVLPIEVYHMRATPPRELPPLPPSLEAVVLTSPRAARLYLEGVGGMPLPCTHWGLGPTTRDAAASLGIDCRIPERPDMESLAEELCRT
jgi:uroporphyrinogen-III synthase